ncbi:hypothetical protein [Paenibacillus tyrfis]|uniref:hypothetical protein n=1 Tax=Paenibacillus tyrfis TaxID=1501230 RepID=UPI00117F8010|nr:hypothetical protein [Paenibacillus tyrfis]
MSTFLYFLFGLLDSIAVFILIFKTFRWPIRQYWIEILISGGLISFLSYVNRIIFHIPNWDMTLQFIAYISLLMWMFRVNLPNAINLAAIGYLAFVGIQFIVYPLLLELGIVNVDDAQELTGFGTYIIQVSSEIACYSVSYLIWKLNIGFSYVSQPPHDRFTFFKIKGNKFAYISNVIAVLVVCSTMYWVFNYVHGQFVVLGSVWGALVILLVLSYRRDYGYD